MRSSRETAAQATWLTLRGVALLSALGVVLLLAEVAPRSASTFATVGALVAAYLAATLAMLGVSAAVQGAAEFVEWAVGVVGGRRRVGVPRMGMQLTRPAPEVR